MTKSGKEQGQDAAAPSAAYLSPSFDDEPEVELVEPVDDDELTDDNRPIEHRK
ncbi:MAG: hypothetical protein JWN80_2403 [Microbacteriaceae bacterium]|jgi:hypothetical protein|nr:hypothetical protein [Microbacteriaceae bacterium]